MVYNLRVVLRKALHHTRLGMPLVDSPICMDQIYHITEGAGSVPILAHLSVSRVRVEASLISWQCLKTGSAVWQDVGILGILPV